MRQILLVTGALLVLCATPDTSSAQFIDSIKQAFTYKPKLDVRYDNRNSFITARFARISGIKLGLDFNKTVKVGLGYNWLSNDRTKDIVHRFEDGSVDTISAGLKFTYWSPYMEYAFYKTYRWEISIPVMVGFGRSLYRYDLPNGGEVKTPGKFMLQYEPYMIGQYRFFKWFGAGLGVGYRVLLVGNSATDENFNSPIYVYKFKVFIGEIYDSFNSLKKL